MRKISINLPPIYRLEVKLTKSRELISAPIIPDIGKIVRIKKGSKISRFGRHIFEHAKVKKILPAYFAIMVMTSAYMPSLALQNVAASEVATPQSSQTLFQFKTEAGIRYPVTGTIRMTTKYSFYHPGIDLDGITGDPIYPMAGGIVTKIQYSRFAYGNAVYVDHGNGISTLYAHLSKIDVKEGDEVTHVTKLGEMGATGRAFGDHLHFEVYEDGKTINPMSILPKKVSY